MENKTENREVAIQLSGVKKMYKLGQIGGGTLQGDLQSWWARVRGKEDPNSKIGSDQRSNGKTFMALNGIDLTVYKGEALGIIGGNGAGKSTMLKLLSRVTAPTEGEIDIYGRIASMLEVGTGFSGEMTGRENVYMNGAILGMTKAEIDAKMEDIIEFSEVREFIDTPVKRYSSGMYVKLAFSVAAHLDSEIMIMDEVLAVGDMAFQKKCLNKMREAAKQEGRTVLYVSHNMNTIRQLCDRCIVLDKGKVVFEGGVEESINRYMNTTKSLAVVNDCSGEHKGPQTDKKVHIDTVTFLNTDFPIYQTGDSVMVKVDYTAKCELSNLAMRMTVQAGDKNVVGLATSNPVICAKEGKNEAVLTLKLDWLAPGKYIIKLTAYSVNEFGMNQMHDVVDDCCAFEKVQSMDDNNRMNWNHSWWGYMMFPELEVK
jgi:lipopolysaccharide transport system ATP-binding protein